MQTDLDRIQAEGPAKISRLQTELAALQKCLDAANEEKKRREGELKSKRAALRNVVAQRDGLRAGTSKLQERVAAEKRKRADISKEVSLLQSELERARKAVRDLENATAARARESDRFYYVLAFNGQVGSIPRSVLASAPESVLYKMYCGAWDYARDEDGRAIVTCHPDRWAAILEHLATGAVPLQRDSQLLEQARFWNLRRLVARLEALTPGVTVRNDRDEMGFKARLTFVDVTSEYDKYGAELSLTYATPGKRWWKVKVDKDGVFQYPLWTPDTKLRKVTVRSKFGLLLHGRRLFADWETQEFSEGKVEKGWGHRWSDLGYSIHQLDPKAGPGGITTPFPACNPP
ncbi:hypothetical protein KFL_000660160 [Klebsormidium nitens]|uniref:Potassium channel tetramerisation-type BTB domain-containing protein n=1 Tax=Klebsormidium nitens TaxID=105231 RepID=A0A1Y1HVB5_KLENI|nr:hypothetical protein KFL_000660160 [Klebsormidium nitens]|eukprot:GAQ80921.1 hypothetical protein KFL_000660160 [Klebsormidium nitens]